MIASESAFLGFLIALALLLTVARLLGFLARKVGQPSVIGELLAGVVLGPSILGAIAPEAGRALFPTSGSQADMLQVVASLGVILLLLLSGMETDLAAIRGSAGKAFVIAGAGLALPFVAGFVLALALPTFLLANPGERLPFALFVAAAVSMSALPVIVKILIDLDLMRRNVGQLILASGMITDTVGWFLLALIISAAGGGSLSRTGLSLAGLTVFAVISFTLAPPILRRTLIWVDHHSDTNSALLAAVFALVLGGAAITQALGVEAFIGAFLVGIQLSSIPRVHRKVRPVLEAVAIGVFAPVFFASAGLRVQLAVFGSPAVLEVALLVVLVAFLAKFAGAYLGGRIAALPTWLAVGLGAGLNARGAVEIIAATIGLQLGILTPTLYAIIVVMAVITSILAPPGLRWALRHVEPEAAEEERLRREEVLSGSFAQQLNRVLVPVGDGECSLRAARLLTKLPFPSEMDIVVAHVDNSGAGSDEFVDVPELLRGSTRWSVDLPNADGVEWQIRSLENVGGVVPTILAEAASGYDLLVLGAEARPNERAVFGKVIDQLALGAPCPVLVLWMPMAADALSVKRIILPTDATVEAEEVASVAVTLAKGLGAEVVAVHVVELHGLGELLPGASVTSEVSARDLIGRRATRIVRSLGDLLGVTVRTDVSIRAGGGVRQAILNWANAPQTDLIFLTAHQRRAGANLYLGATVEFILHYARCPVAILFPTPAHAIGMNRLEAA